MKIREFRLYLFRVRENEIVGFGFLIIGFWEFDGVILFNGISYFLFRENLFFVRFKI